MNSDDGQVGKRACAAMTLIGLVVLSACSDAPRPKESELALSSYESTCGQDNYDENCKDKFIIWDGVIESDGDDYVKVAFGGTNKMDVQGVTAKKLGLVQGQLVQVSGWLDDENFMYPDIRDGKISATESSSEAQSRSSAEESQRREEGQAYSQKMDDELTKCKIINAGTQDQAIIRDCLYDSMN